MSLSLSQIYTKPLISFCVEYKSAVSFLQYMKTEMHSGIYFTTATILNTLLKNYQQFTKNCGKFSNGISLC